MYIPSRAPRFIWRNPLIRQGVFTQPLHRGGKRVEVFNVDAVLTAKVDHLGKLRHGLVAAVFFGRRHRARRASG